MDNRRLNFSQKHPFLFAMLVVVAAVVLIVGIMAVFQFKIKKLFLEKNRLGVVNIQGTISKSRNIVSWLNQLVQDDSIKGIIVRINSPGGSVAASQEIYQAIKEASYVKPVVVSMGDVAASGGYYVACGATKIVANPGTITGSIGVIAKFPNIEKLLNKLGIEDQTITSGKFKDTGSMTRKLSEEEVKYIKDLVNDLHLQFVRAVASGRHLPLERVKAIANGKVYTGSQAKALGLVDVLGGFNTAVKEIKKLCKIKGKVSLVEGPKSRISLWNLLFESEISKKINECLLNVFLRRIVCTPF